ncbi:MAG: dihydrodipicolinate synthase family protein [Clostridia bacterium]|nr:dihydrodipicolinate synthase family protein [Clostridia bacterium]
MNRHEVALEKLKKGTVIPATPLALDENRKLSEKGLRLLMNYYLNCGVGGIATAVHTTQFEIRKPEIALFEPVLKIVSEEIDKFEKKNDTVIVKVAGVCGPTEQAVKEAELAKKYGYDAVLLSPGGLNDMSEEYLIERTQKVAAIMPVIGFYLQTAVGGRVFSYNYWEKVCATKNVVAIKCASFHRYTTFDVVRAAAMSERSDEITLYTGNDDNIVIDLLTNYSFTKDGKTVKKGFEGGLLGHWSVWTRKAVEIFDKIKAEKNNEKVSSELLTLAAEVTDTNSAFFDTANGFAGCIAGLHEVLRRQGLMENIYCLNPQETMSEGQVEEINRIYAAYPHLNDDKFIADNIEEWKKSAEC